MADPLDLLDIPSFDDCDLDFELMVELLEFIQGKPAQIQQFRLIVIADHVVGLSAEDNVIIAFVEIGADFSEVRWADLQFLMQFSAHCAERVFAAFNTAARQPPAPFPACPEAGMYGEQVTVVVT